MTIAPNQQQLSAGGANVAVRVVAVIRRQAPGARYQDWRAIPRLGTTDRGLERRSRSSLSALRLSSLRSSGNLGWGFVGSSHFSHSSSRGASLPIARRRRAAGLQRQSVVPVPVAGRRGGVRLCVASRSRRCFHALHHVACKLSDAAPSHSVFAFRGRPLRGEQPTTRERAACPLNQSIRYLG